MQTIKEKLNDMSHLRKAKAEAKEEEQEEREIAKTRIEVAKEVRMAREAEAAMDLHVNKAADKVAQQEAKCAQTGLNAQLHSVHDHTMQSPHGRNADDGFSTRSTYDEDIHHQDPFGRNAGNLAHNPSAGTDYPHSNSLI